MGVQLGNNYVFNPSPKIDSEEESMKAAIASYKAETERLEKALQEIQEKNKYLVIKQNDAYRLHYLHTALPHNVQESYTLKEFNEKVLRENLDIPVLEPPEQYIGYSSFGPSIGWAGGSGLVASGTMWPVGT